MTGFKTLGVGLAGILVASIATIFFAQNVSAASALLPDLKTTIPHHLSIQNDHQKEFLRFSNGVANTGAGPLQIIAVIPASDPTQTQDAIQQILDENGNIVEEKLVSKFTFHEQHNHWHIADVALFEVRQGSVDGPVVGTSTKITSCLIDWYKIDDNSKTKERTYWECNGELQGISPGWVDQYHHALADMEVEITGAELGQYYLVSTANPNKTFIETDDENNTAWVSFDLKRDSNGNAKIDVTGHSACEPGLCSEKVPNR